MKKTGVFVLISLLGLLALYPSVSAQDSGVSVNQEAVTVSLANQGLQVKEEITVTNQGAENATMLRFWFQQDAQNIKIIAVQSGKELTPVITGYIRTCNLTQANLTIQPGAVLGIQITYPLPTAAQYFEISLLYETALLTVTYKEGSSQQELFHGEQLLLADSQNTLRVLLHKPTEASLDITMMILVFFIVVIVLASLLLLLKKQRSKTKIALVDSEETLTTKKALLLSLLKDLEKQYRVKAISDETYTKVKDEYKAQAVSVMKQLDDLKK